MAQTNALSAFTSLEARNPKLGGREDFGAEISEFAHANRKDCPEEKRNVPAVD